MSLYNYGLNMYSTEGMTINNGGAYIRAGMTLGGGFSTLMQINNGLTIFNAGLNVQSLNVVGSLQMQPGKTVSLQRSFVSNSGMTQMGGTFVLNDNLLVQDTGLVITNGLSITSGSLYCLDGLSVASLLVPGSTKIQSMTVNAGMVVLTPIPVAALSVYGMSIAGGLTITGRATLADGYYPFGTGTRVTTNNDVSIAGDYYSNFITSHYLIVTNGITIQLNTITSNNDIMYSVNGITVSGGANFVAPLIVTGILSSRGPMSVTSGGLYVTGAMTVNSGGVTLYNAGITVSNTGVYVLSGGAMLGSNLIMSTASGTVYTTGVFIQGSTTVSTGGVVVSSGNLNVNSNGFKVTGGLSISSGLQVLGALSISQGTILITGGISLYGSSGIGLIVKSGDATVTSNAYINGDLNVLASGITVPSSLTIGEGLVITGGMTVGTASTNGMYVDAGGLTVSANGMTVINSLSILGTGLNVNAIIVTGGLTIIGQPLIVNSIGTRISAGLTILQNPMFIKNSLTIFDTGLWISGGSTVSGNVFLQFNPTVYSDKRLKKNIVRIGDNESLDKIRKLRGVYYSWKNENYDESNSCGKNHSNYRRIGFIAQEVAEIIPEIINESDSEDVIDKYLGIRYIEVLPFAIGAVKELKNRLISIITIFEDKMSFIKTKQDFDDYKYILSRYINIYNDLTRLNTQYSVYAYHAIMHQNSVNRN